MGALNAVGMSMYPKGQEKEMANNLTSFWNSLNSSDVYKAWGPLGIFSGLDKAGLYDNQAFENVIDKFFDKGLYRKIAFTITNLDDGLPEVYSEKNDREVIKKVLMAS